MVIYADVLLAVNWWVDFLLLLAVRRFMGLGARSWRLVLGALLGGVFSFSLFLPPIAAWLSLLLKLAAAGLMILTAFGWHDRRRFLRALLLLFGLSAGLSGLCSALYYFAAPRDLVVFNGVVYYAVSPWLLLGLTVLCYGVLWLFEVVIRRRAPREMHFKVRIRHADRSVLVNCLYDSGNHLTEPFSNRGVIVVERAAIEGLLPLPKNIEGLPPNGLWRVVPFDTLGGGGLLPAFSPTSVTAITPRGERLLSDCYVAVCERLGRGEYEGLIGSALGDQLSWGLHT